MLMEEQATVGSRIKKLREQLDLKQADFAQQLSEDPKKISRIEKEVQFPDSNFLIQLGERLDVSLDWILRGIGKMFLSDSDSSSANFFLPKSIQEILLLFRFMMSTPRQGMEPSMISAPSRRSSTWHF